MATTTISVSGLKPSGASVTTAITFASADDFYRVTETGGVYTHAPTGITSSQPIQMPPFVLGLIERVARRVEAVSVGSATEVSNALSDHVSDHTSDVNSLSAQIDVVSDGLSDHVSDHTSDVTSLTTAISDGNSNGVVISDALSDHISDHLSDVTSLTNAVTSITAEIDGGMSDVSDLRSDIDGAFTEQQELLNRALLINPASGSGTSMDGAIARMSNYLTLLSRAAPVFSDSTNVFWFGRHYRTVDAGEAAILDTDHGYITATTVAAASSTLSSDATAYSFISDLGVSIFPSAWD